MRARFFLFAVVVLLALAAHLALLTNRVSQQSEDAMRSRLSTASAGVRTQIALLDASLPAPHARPSRRGPARPRRRADPRAHGRDEDARSEAGRAGAPRRGLGTAGRTR